MKNFILGILSLTVFFNTQAQTSVTPEPSFKFPPLDKSPMDMIYFPVNYPVLKIQEKINTPPLARLIYSRPQKEGRDIFGGLISYDKVWRLGANEATEIEFFRDVMVKETRLPKGRYTLYAIPTPTQWTVIFNKETDLWGAFKYDEKSDALRISLPVQQNKVPVEALSMNFFATSTGADLAMAWDEVTVVLPITFK